MTKEMYNFFSWRTEKRLKGSLNKCTIWEFWLELHLKIERKKKKRQKHCYMKLCCELNCFFHFFLFYLSLGEHLKWAHHAWEEKQIMIKTVILNRMTRKSVETELMIPSKLSILITVGADDSVNCNEEWSRICYQKQKQIYQGPKEASASGLSSDQAIGVSVSCRKF